MIQCLGAASFSSMKASNPCMYDGLHFNLLETARNINLVKNYADEVDKQNGICLTTLLKK